MSVGAPHSGRKYPRSSRTTICSMWMHPAAASACGHQPDSGVLLSLGPHS